MELKAHVGITVYLLTQAAAGNAVDPDSRFSAGGQLETSSTSRGQVENTLHAWDGGQHAKPDWERALPQSVFESILRISRKRALAMSSVYHRAWLQSKAL